MERLLLRPVEVAETLGIARSKVYEMLASGEIPSLRIGKSVRVPVDALHAWVHSRVTASDSYDFGQEAAARTHMFMRNTRNNDDH